MTNLMFVRLFSGDLGAETLFCSNVHALESLERMLTLDPSQVSCWLWSSSKFPFMFDKLK